MKYTFVYDINKQIYMSFFNSIGTSSITKVESHKDLGIILSSNLTWDAHYDQIIAKAYGDC